MPDPATPAAGRAEVRDTWPFFILVTMVILAGYLSALRTIESLRSPLSFVPFTLLMLLITGLYWCSPFCITTERRRLAFILVQIAATFAVGLMTPRHWLVMGLYPSLIGVTIGSYWPKVRSIAAMTVLILSFLAVNMALGWDFAEMRPILPLMGLSLVFVFVYVALFVRQVDARTQAQDLLHDLEEAHARLGEYAAQVEQLTLTQERERMGRELHDTLAQGLAGLIMQLEAIDHHLEDGNAGQGKVVLTQAMEQARTALHEARRAIQALRASPLEEGSLAEAVEREAERFTETHGVPCDCRVNLESIHISPELAQDIFRIVQESLSNVARHATATRVTLALGQRDGAIRMVVEDDGIGFDTGADHSGFGLQGMRERAARHGAELRVESAGGSGTRVVLEAKGEAP